MCGVFGFVSDSGRASNLKRLRDMAKVTERRGPHAFGFAWIDSRGRLRCYKRTGRISDHLGLLAMASDARMLIGHCRYATHGDPGDNLNNHPHAADGGWFVHNGIFANYREIQDEYDLAPVTECDSETIGLMLEHLDGTLMDRCAGAVCAIDGGSPAVFLGLWSKPARLVVIRRGNPLHVGVAGAGVYFASLKGGLPRDARRVGDHTVTVYRHNKQGEYRVEEGMLAESWSTEIADGEAEGGPADLRSGTAGSLSAVSVHADAKGATREVRRGCWFD